MNKKLIAFALIALNLQPVSIRSDDLYPSLLRPLPPQALADALYKIGAKANDIGPLEKSGTPTSELIETFGKYARNSNSPAYNNLFVSERNALVFFGFRLSAQGEINNEDLKKLLYAEKLRVGMPKTEVKELMTIVSQIKDNPQYVYTHSDVETLNLAAPYIDKDPYAFSDILGTLIQPILPATPETIGIPMATEKVLIDAARTITGLRPYKMDNIQDIADQYEGSNTFTPTNDNIDDVNEVMEASYYPNSAYLLLPFISADALTTLSKIPKSYTDSFSEEVVDQYLHEVVESKAVEDYSKVGAYPRYNTNWIKNKDPNKGDRPGTQSTYSKNPVR